MAYWIKMILVGLLAVLNSVLVYGQSAEEFQSCVNSEKQKLLTAKQSPFSSPRDQEGREIRVTCSQGLYGIIPQCDRHHQDQRFLIRAPNGHKFVGNVTSEIVSQDSDRSMSNANVRLIDEGRIEAHLTCRAHACDRGDRNWIAIKVNATKQPLKLSSDEEKQVYSRCLNKG